MKFYIVKPEVSGGIGQQSVIDTSCHPPEVKSLHYVFDGWSGDALVTSFPCYIVTSSARMQLESNKVSGLVFSGVLISTSLLFREMFPNKELPDFG